MKDIVITGKKVRTELFIALGCLIFAECLNVFAVIKYSRPAVELISMIGFVVVAAVITYLLLLLVRLLVALVVCAVRKIKG